MRFLLRSGLVLEFIYFGLKKGQKSYKLFIIHLLHG